MKKYIYILLLSVISNGGFAQMNEEPIRLSTFIRTKGGIGLRDYNISKINVNETAQKGSFQDKLFYSFIERTNTTELSEAEFDITFYSERFTDKYFLGMLENRNIKGLKNELSYSNDYSTTDTERKKSKSRKSRTTQKTVRTYYTENDNYRPRDKEEVAIWRFTNVNGEFRLRGYYRYQYSTTSGLEDKQQNTMYSAGLLLNTKSYIWTPKFLRLDIGGEFNPEKSSNTYIVIPDQAESRTLAKVNASANFFESKPVSLVVFGNYDYGYTNRENLTNLKSNDKGWGSTLLLTNHVLPASLYYRQNWWRQIEIPDGRTYYIDQKNMMGIANKSFSGRDKNEFNISRDYYLTKQDFQPTNMQTTDEIRLNDQVYFDKHQKYRFASDISKMNQTGNIAQKRFQAIEQLSFQLPHDLRLMTNYSYYKFDWIAQSSKQNNFSGRLQYTLFESLTMGVTGEYLDTRHTFYHEKITKAGVDFLYLKKLPTKGLLTLSYSYLKQRNNMLGSSLQIQVFTEQHTLTDGVITLLNKALVDTNTIVIWNGLGNIIYQNYLDYILIPHNEYTEILRIPGGQIPNGGSILVNYTFTQPGAFQYDANGNNFSVSVMLFDRLVEVYYRMNRQDFSNIKQTENLTLDYYNQNFYGIKLNYKVVEVGAEYDDYNSTIIPYKMTRYFLNILGNFNPKVIYGLNGNIRHYQYTSDNTKQEYDDINGNLTFLTGDFSKIALNAGYRYQNGSGIDLNLFTARAEYSTNIRKIYINAWVDFYKRTYVGDKLNFAGGTIQIARRF